MRAHGVVALALTGVVACGAFIGTSADEGNPRPAAPGPSSDAASADAAGSGGVVVIDPGTRDAGERETGPTFCTTRNALFCADFDRENPPTYGFTGASGSLTLDKGFDSPNALSLTAGATQGSKNAQFLHWDAVGVPPVITVKLQLNVASVPPNGSSSGDARLVHVECGDGDGMMDVALKSSQLLEVRGANVAVSMPKSIPLDTWIEVIASWQVGSAVTLTVPAVDTITTLGFTNGLCGASFGVYVGFLAFDPPAQDAFRVRYDNIEVSYP